MAARTLALRQPEIIDLVSDDSDFEPPAPATPAGPAHQPTLELDDNGILSPVDEVPLGFFEDFAYENELQALGQLRPQPVEHELPVPGQYVNIDGEDVFIPDEVEVAPQPVPGSPGVRALEDGITVAGAAAADDEVAAAMQDAEFTADTCLQRILAIFPDVSHDHVHKLYTDFDTNGDYENLPGPARMDNIIDQLVDTPNYPRQEKGKQTIRKRKREASIDETAAETQRWENVAREPAPTFLKASMQSMLKAEYPDATTNFINDTLAREKHFYQAFVALFKAKSSGDLAFSRGRPARKTASANVIATNSGWPALTEELAAARIRVGVLQAQHAEEDAKKQAEEENLQHAKERGETAECQACFDGLPMNRQIHCDGETAHWTCYDCITNYIKSEVGDSRCRVLCTAGCGAGFAPRQLNLLADKQLLEKLAELEQEKAIRDAGLEDLEECPFCDYKAIMPSIEEDFEFRCANPECEKVSCRRCKSISHIPVSCEEHAQDNKINSRHKIEEAMTAALVRSCKKCKKQFIKEYGCNKMSCPSCMNLQCYVCSETITNYNHFDQVPSGRTQNGKGCPLYDNVEERHEREVKEAEAAARKQMLEENPDLNEEDVEIKVSDAVKKATATRIQQGARADEGYGGAFGVFGMPGDMDRMVRRVLREADDEDDEDEDDDNDDFEERANAFHGARRRFNLQALRLQQARAQADVQWRLRDRALAAAALAPAPPAAPQLRPAAIPLDPAAMQGYIPVFGLPQPAPQPNAPPPPPAPAFIDPFADDFGPLQPPAANVLRPGNRYGAGLGFGPAGDRPFGAGIRQHRQNFEELENMRRRHNEEMLERAQQREEGRVAAMGAAAHERRNARGGNVAGPNDHADRLARLRRLDAANRAMIEQNNLARAADLRRRIMQRREDQREEQQGPARREREEEAVRGWGMPFGDP